jgi:hypothetical protein
MALEKKTSSNPSATSSSRLCIRVMGTRSTSQRSMIPTIVITCAGGLAQWSCVWPRDLVHPASVRIRHPPPQELFGTIEVTTCANAVVSTNQNANNWRIASPPATLNLAFTVAPGYRESLAIYAIAPPKRRLFKYRIPSQNSTMR